MCALQAFADNEISFVQMADDPLFHRFHSDSFTALVSVKSIDCGTTLAMVGMRGQSRLSAPNGMRGRVDSLHPWDAWAE
jgi:hypothetical protein